MTEPLTIIIPGKPIGKARSRFGKGHAYTTPETRAYEEHIGYIARREMAGREPLKSPVVMQVMAHFEIPASWSQVERQKALIGITRHTRKPDGDNIIKSLADALNKIVYVDDKQIVRFEVEKRYGPRAFVVVTIKEVEGAYAEQEQGVAA